MHSSAHWPGKGPVLLAIALGFAFAAPPLIREAAEGPFFASSGESFAAAVASRAAESHALKAAIATPVAAKVLLPADEYRRYAAIVDAASRAHGVEAALVHAVIFAESSYDPDARSPAGAAGLMQLMPITAKHYGVKDLFDPTQNIQGGVTFLRDLLRQFNGNVELALAAYNAGSTAVVRAGNRIPPLAETQAYVPKVIDHYRRLRAIEG